MARALRRIWHVVISTGLVEPVQGGVMKSHRLASSPAPRSAFRCRALRGIEPELDMTEALSELLDRLRP